MATRSTDLGSWKFPHKNFHVVKILNETVLGQFPWTVSSVHGQFGVSLDSFQRSVQGQIPRTKGPVWIRLEGKVMG